MWQKSRVSLSDTSWGRTARCCQRRSEAAPGQAQRVLLGASRSSRSTSCNAGWLMCNGQATGTQAFRALAVRTAYSRSGAGIGGHVLGAETLDPTSGGWVPTARWDNSIHSRHRGWPSRSSKTGSFLVFSKTWLKVPVPKTQKARGWRGKQRGPRPWRSCWRLWLSSYWKSQTTQKKLKQGNGTIRCTVYICSNPYKLLFRKCRQEIIHTSDRCTEERREEMSNTQDKKQIKNR